MSGSHETLLQIHSLGADYRRGRDWRPVLHDIDLQLAAGEFIGLVGESGSGKSTLAALLLGERRDDRRIASGQVTFKGIDLFAASRRVVHSLRGSQIAFVPQNCGASLTPTLRIGALFAETLRRHQPNLDKSAARKVTLDLLREVELGQGEAALSRYPHEFSGGQQQRIALALAVSCRPELLVLDEPTTGLDPILRRSITGLLRRLCREHGVAMIFVSHDLATVAELCERIIVINAGRIVETGSAAAIFGAPRHEYTRTLIRAMPQLDRPSESPRVSRATGEDKSPSLATGWAPLHLREAIG
ncbi:hypothetical protein C3941_04360 [Kaistia algarum]|uniref:ABC transporter ATP-binding protein n=1 Tax=Kaistia algarum TaxID=2083279 RepID=UPI000CE7F93E|nr:ABC transporter ATP-binding protein [Kaistia algarum]MCX5512549.1 ABC transporter ATP-binding protein [Kaistia algarum]PPE81924.1 hypothetical protein C3941_04360 [Kaistia algarum]